ncbi:glycoside hydrolase family 3 N-terminal domain-containing protein [Puia dinghuensis]|uniref:Beta-glucosidase n=1 Tax=Puia dinghuensis TaxID=1792502 RepID=A0A8J2UDQ7_9BACT|nr:glycoside hydrolase family 3 N-terminal domain-containing protein [Puia dinghuensis]GGB02285.1 hypothetical protein GCM10011511_26930 [Puia dinghuensis]
MSKKKLILLVSSIVFCIINARAQQTLPYLDSNLSIEARITDLLPRLTLEEKIVQLSDSWGSKGIPRLKVPAMLKTEGLHGQSYSTGATIFPQAIAMASTFDTALVHNIGKTTAIESKAAGLRVTWSPVLDVARDVRWGRVEETYGEDPYLVSRMGVAWINGFQNEGMIAVPKHFAGHGEPLGGRDSHDVGLSDRTMRNVHLVPFRAAIKEAHAGGVMAAYSTWDAVPDNGSNELLQKILREEWGFDGIVVSDCSAPENFLRKQSVVYNLDEAAKMAILAGVDIECGSVNAFTLAGAIKRGVLKERDLDVNLRRVFRAKYRLGLFDRPGPDKMNWEKLPVYDIPPHRELAREAAIKGSVLLKNDRNLLPLSKDIKTIAVIGPNADMAQTGDYSAKAGPGQLVTVLQGIKSHVSAGTTILYEKGCNVESMDSSGFERATAAASKADAVVVVVGDYSNNNPAIEHKEKNTTGENVDGATLEIPGVQRQLIRRIAATGKPVVLVLVNGKPFVLTWEAEHLAAILETWYPGEEGGNATADILFGDANPSGRLPVTFPRHVGQLPLRYDYLPSGRNYDYYDMPFTPLYRFGYGLSYTTFHYSNLTTAVNGDGTVAVSVDIENTGNRAGDEVAQLYLTDMISSVITPVITLKGFQRVHLDTGEKKTIGFRLSPYQLSLLDASMERVVELGRYRVHVGGVSPESPPGNTEHKGKIGYNDPKEGVSGEFEINTRYKASFMPGIQAPSGVKGGVAFPVTVTVTNEGNITDVADIKIYGETLLDDYRSEIDPGQSFTHTFEVTLYRSGRQTITVIVGKKLLTWPVNVAQSPAMLTLDNARLSIGDDGVLHYEATAVNGGSVPYSDSLRIMVNDNAVVSQLLVLKAGERRDVQYSYAFPAAGAYRVRIGNGSEQRLMAPGGVGLALQNPLLYLDFDQAGAKDDVSGASLKVQGAAQYPNGKNGWAFYSSDKQTFIPAGGLDLYRKSFTLASWVKVDSYENGQAMFFGGQAPMGADVDNTGTVLAAGVQNEALLLSFQDRDLKGNARVPTGQWVHLAYTYDAENNKGTLYINGRLDKSAAQKAYAGPLDIIGGAPRFGHGRFAMDEVLVARNCLSPSTIKELCEKGIGGLRNGEVVTEWRDIKTAISTLRYNASVPKKSSAVLTIETEGEDHRPLASRIIPLKDGEQSLALEGLKGARVRIKITLSAADWTATPAVQTVVLTGTDGDLARWSVTNEWKKATISGGLTIGKQSL